MAKDLREITPVCISLGNIARFFMRKGQKTGDIDTIDKQLLGDEAFEDFYYVKNSARRISDYVSGKQDVEYSQGYLAAKRIYELYFNENGSKYSKRTLLRNHIYRAWKNRLESSIPKYNETISYFLEDATLLTSEEKSVICFRQYLMKFSKASKTEERAEFLTVLTLLSITRTFWGLINPDDILPANPDREPDSTVNIDSFDHVKKLLSKKKYEEAIKHLNEIIVYDVYKTNAETKEDLSFINKSNGRAFYLLSNAYRELRNSYAPNDPLYKKYTDDIRSSLDKAANFHYIPAMLEIARDHFSPPVDAIYDTDISTCIKMCKALIKTNVSHESGTERYNKECGEAFWMLYYLETDDKKAENYLEKSASYSYPKAVKEWTKNHAVSLVQTLKKSTDSVTGHFYTNDSNLYSVMICKTAPKSWKKGDYPLYQDKTANDNDFMTFSLNGLQKYFLISDNFDRNLKELLQLLQIVKDHASTFKDKQFEFYIRGVEDEIYPFVDTALARISFCVPVHILDDNKMAARVLAKHPLFYPIRKLKNTKSSSLNFIVIGATPCCEWIIREAFWMLTFRNTNIRTKMILISPEADKVEKRLNFKCPDLNNKQISGGFPEIEKAYCEFDTIDVITEIKKHMNGEYTYLIIDTGSDTFNASLAIKLRETAIRQSIHLSDDELNKEFPVIAFRCQDPDIANLTRRSIVLNESYGSKWFNNYALIPFGSADQNYTWDELTNNLFEILGLNIHLQYYKDSTLLKPDSTEYDTRYREAEKSFWARSYNRDSSIAAAMSIPYRLYQCSLTDNDTPILPIGSDPLDNKPLSILDDDAFFSEEAFQSYAVKFKEAGKHAERISKEVIKEIKQEAENISDMAKHSFSLCYENTTEKTASSSERSLCSWNFVHYQKPGYTQVSANYPSQKQGIFKKGNILCKYFIEDDPDSELYQLAEWEHNRWIRFMISRGWTIAEIRHMKLYHQEENKRQQLYIGKMHPCMIPYEKIAKVDKEWSSLIGKPYSFKENDIFAIHMTEQILNMEWTKTRDMYLHSKEFEAPER